MKPPPTAALYARISADPTGRALGVARQLEDCRRLAATLGYDAVCEYVDNDISAYRGGHRPGYSSMLDAIKDGRHDAIICWHPDRLHRRPIELEAFIDLIDAHQVTVRTVTAGHWDLSTPSGRMTARILGAVARQESEHKSERVRRALMQRQENGLRHGRTPYGWRADGEAAIVDRIVTSILAGDSLNRLARTLNDEGIPAPQGGKWTGVQVRQVAHRWSNAGLMADGKPGKWDAIVTQDQQERVVRLLDAPGRHTPRTVRRHLLSGVLKCGTCEAPLRWKPTRPPSASYACPEHHVSITAPDTEDWVLDLVQARLDAPDARDLSASPDDQQAPLRALLDGLRARLEGLAEDYADGVLSREQVRVARARIEERIAVTEGELAQLDTGRNVLAPHAGADIRSLPWDRQRRIIEVLMDPHVMPAGRTGRFDPSRIQARWKA